MIGVTSFPAIQLACLVACMAFYLPGAVDTVHAAENNTVAAVQNESGKISGKVTDIIGSGGITYVEIDTGKEKLWAAGPGATALKKGDMAAFTTEMPMYNFHSKVLGRDFSVIYFIKQFITDKASATNATAKDQVSKPHTVRPANTTSAAANGAVEIGGYLREATLDGLNAKNRNISDFKGKPLIINLWASWCGPCRAEMGSLMRLAERYNGKEFNIIGITIDDYRDKAEAFIKQAGISFENFQDHKLQMEKMLGGTTIPLTVLVDDQGRILHKVNGAREWDRPDIVAAIEKAFRMKLQD